MNHFRNLTWSELLEACQQPAPQFLPYPASIREDKEFYGTANYAEAMTLARNGWSEGAKAIAELSETITAPDAEVMEAFYDVAGSSVDIGRYLSGEPENMMEFQPKDRRQNGKILTIHVNASLAAGIQKETVMQRGAAICSLIDQLERMQYRVELFVWTRQVTRIVKGRGRSRHYGPITNDAEVKVCVKQSGEPLEMDRVAFALAHPSFNRRLSFRLRETLPQYMAKDFCLGNYGISSDIDPEVRGEGLYLPKISDNNFQNVNYCKAWIAEQVQKFQTEGQTK